MTERACHHCVYWDRGPDEDGDPEISDVGMCRRNSPVRKKGDTLGVWPWTARTDWCGSFDPGRVCLSCGKPMGYGEDTYCSVECGERGERLALSGVG